MEDHIILNITSRIKDIRREKEITVQELADRATVSKGLISQIENNRSIPSLSVLINIIKSLNVNLDEFFSGISHEFLNDPVIVKRKNDHETFEKEQAIGFLYKRIFAKAIKSSAVDIVILELEPGASRPMVVTDAFEYKYIISGTVDYIFEHQNYQLFKGDSILFDGRLPHTPQNNSNRTAVMLIVYFFNK